MSRPATGTAGTARISQAGRLRAGWSAVRQRAARHATPRRQALAGLALLLVLLAVPGTRQALEASMWRHMLLQAPLLMLAGAVLAGALPAPAPAWRAAMHTASAAWWPQRWCWPC